MSRFDMLSRPLTGGESYWQEDLALRHLVRRILPEAAWRFAEPQLQAMGALAPQRVDELAALADRHGPTLHTHDRTGARQDAIEYHPAYRELQTIAYGGGLVALKYDPLVRAAHPESLHAIGFALGYLFSQAEAGLYCPLCMTDGAARILERHAQVPLAAYYVPRLASRHVGDLMTGAMFLTEKQGGSDVGRNATRAVPDGQDELGAIWRLYGEKWFCSNVDAGVALVLARPDGAPDGTRGLGLFLVPRPLPDGSRNAGVLVDRIKPKLGTRSMPTGEVRLDGAVAYAVGEVDRGFRIMAEMVNLSRLYNAVASAAAMRRAYHEAASWARAREAFGRPVGQHPLCAATVADLAADSVGAMAHVFAAVHALDRSDARGTEQDARLLRLLTPLAKGSLGKMAVASASEAMEVIGGNGYVEDWALPRLLRDAQVLPIWEGTTNIQVLDAFRAILKEQAHEVLFEVLRAAVQPGVTEAVPAALDVMAALDELQCALPRLGEAGERAQHLWRTWFDRAAAVTQVAMCLREAFASPVLEGDEGLAAGRLFSAAAERLARKRLRGQPHVLAALGTSATDADLVP